MAARPVSSAWVAAAARICFGSAVMSWPSRCTPAACRHGRRSDPRIACSVIVNTRCAAAPPAYFCGVHALQLDEPAADHEQQRAHGGEAELQSRVQRTQAQRARPASSSGAAGRSAGRLAGSAVAAPSWRGQAPGGCGGAAGEVRVRRAGRSSAARRRSEAGHRLPPGSVVSGVGVGVGCWASVCVSVSSSPPRASDGDDVRQCRSSSGASPSLRPGRPRSGPRVLVRLLVIGGFRRLLLRRACPPARSSSRPGARITTGTALAGAALPSTRTRPVAPISRKPGLPAGTMPSAAAAAARFAGAALSCTWFSSSTSRAAALWSPEARSCRRPRSRPKRCSARAAAPCRRRAGPG